MLGRYRAAVRAYGSYERSCLVLSFSQANGQDIRRRPDNGSRPLGIVTKKPARFWSAVGLALALAIGGHVASLPWGEVPLRGVDRPPFPWVSVILRAAAFVLAIVAFVWWPAAQTLTRRASAADADTAPSSGRAARPWRCAPWLRVLTCVLALVFAWWPHSVLLDWAVNPVQMGGYAIPFFVLSWFIGVFVALARLGDPESAMSERLVLLLAVFPPADFFLLAAIRIAYFDSN